MDKKKVTKQLGNVEKYLLAYEKSGKNADIAMAFQQLHEAQDEVQKPDWISVEDKLPSYDDTVLVCHKDFPCIVRISTRVTGDKNRYTDSYGFTRNEFDLSVTHWRKIDKLEV